MPDRKLTDRQKHFIAAYTDHSAKTFKNATQSYMDSHPTASYETAKTQGSKALAAPHIRQSIDEILEESEAGYKVRLRHLVDLSLGRIQIHTLTTNPDGSTTTVARDIPPSDRIKALKLLSDLTGETEQARVQAEIMSESQRKLAKDMFKRAMRSVTPEGSLDGAEGGNGGGAHTIHSPSKMTNIEKVEPPMHNGDEEE